LKILAEKQGDMQEASTLLLELTNKYEQSDYQKRRRGVIPGSAGL
jgi:hypothetical protein